VNQNFVNNVNQNGGINVLKNLLGRYWLI
jgi:hypothetical protein